MILDTSALVALVVREPGYERLIGVIEKAPYLGIGAPTLVELGIVLSARLRMDARGLIARILTEMEIEVLPFGPDHANVALDAWLRFGKGRHPASLNLGDCHSYATASLAGLPLLCVGEDFEKTDLEIG